MLFYEKVLMFYLIVYFFVFLVLFGLVMVVWLWLLWCDFLYIICEVSNLGYEIE